MTEMISKATLRVAYSDSDPSWAGMMTTLLAKRWNVEVVSNNADLVFFGVYPGYDFLQLNAGIRIFLSQECVLPDFNLADYAFGFARMDFGNRYFRLPNFALHSDAPKLLEDVPPFNTELSARRFCNFIYSHSEGSPARIDLYNAVSTIATVDAPGKLFRNMPALPTAPAGAGWREDKLAFMGNYKFTIACENVQAPGYVTEKLTDAILAGTIPIYWGDPHVSNDFNPDRMIIVSGRGDLPRAIDRIRQLNADDAAYREVLSLPVFNDAQRANFPTFDHIVSFVSAAISNGPQRQDEYMWGRWYADRLRRMARNDKRVIRLANPLIQVKKILLGIRDRT